MVKVYYTHNQIHEQVSQLAKQVQSFQADVIVAIGGGGLIPGRILRTYLEVPVLVVTIESYTREAKPRSVADGGGTPSYTREAKGELFKRQWINDDQIAGKRVLVVDELNDTGSTLVYCVKELQKACPAAVAVAVVHDKDKAKDAVLDESIEYFVGKVVPDRWIVYPWEQ